MVKLLAIAVVISGCYSDRYHCTSDEQCDVAGGRCEIDGFCTKPDDSCPTQRRYQHAGDRGDSCFDDAVKVENACAGGQPAATREGCAVEVCRRMHACCDIAWTDACAQLAQQECTVACDTRITITGSQKVGANTVTELWDVRWVGDRFDIVPNTKFGNFLGWVAPEIGDPTPRLAGANGGRIEVGELAFSIDPVQTVQSLTTIPFGRDRLDTFVIGHVNPPQLSVFKPLVSELDEFPTQGAQFLTWGDFDRDGLPDAITRSGNGYIFHDGRTFDDRFTSNMQNGATDGAPAIRQIDWLDFDNDGELDLAAYGSELRIHTTPETLREAPEFRIDCDPPAESTACTNFDSAAFDGVALPDPVSPAVAISLYPGRKMYLVTLDDGVPVPRQIPFPEDSCSCDKKDCDANGNACKFNCQITNCPPVLAMVARDLDGDHRTDLIAIDASLRIYHAFAPDFAWQGPAPIPTNFPNQLVQITTTVSGAPL